MNTSLSVILKLGVLAALFFSCSPEKKEETETNTNTPEVVEGLNHIFKSGEDGYKCYRIPALVATNNGTLLAFAEGRKGGCSDTGNIDILLKRSTDGGQTWGDMSVVWDDGENTCGNPAPVVDKETGEVFLFSTWNLGSDHEKEIISGESEDTRRIFITSTTDEGQTWSKMRDITSQTKLENWTWYATGPGAGIQLTGERYKGRLVIACDHIMAESIEAYSHAIYSDDHGQTWHFSENAQLQTNESTVAELSNGNLLLNMRNYDRKVRNRQIAISEDGGETWIDPHIDSALIEPICQASLISHSFSEGDHLLMFSNPAHEVKRRNMTIKVSKDDGASWPITKTVHEGPSAYSDLVSLSNGDIAILYEAGEEKPYEGIAFEVLESSEFTDN